MIGPFFRILLAVVVLAGLAAGFAWGFCLWWGLANDGARQAALILAGASAAAIGLCLAGQALGVSGQAYYIVAGGVAFLAADVLLWQWTGLMPGTKPFRNGFIPAGLMGVFAGSLYWMIAAGRRAAPHDYEH